MGRWRIHERGVRALFGARGGVGRLHRAGARQLKTNIQRRAPVDTGRLRASWKIKHVRFDGRWLKAWVYTEVKYAPFLILGTANRGTGYIYPKRAKFLRFRARGGRGGRGRRGRWIFARRVRGIKPRNFVQDALLAMRPPWRIRLFIPRR